MLIKKSERRPKPVAPADLQTDQRDSELDQRAFLQRSGITAGAFTALGSLSLDGLRKAEAGPPAPSGATVTYRKNICTHCSVGCSVIAKVADGVLSLSET